MHQSNDFLLLFYANIFHSLYSLHRFVAFQSKNGVLLACNNIHICSYAFCLCFTKCIAAKRRDIWPDAVKVINKQERKNGCTCGWTEISKFRVGRLDQLIDTRPRVSIYVFVKQRAARSVIALRLLLAHCRLSVCLLTTADRFSIPIP